MDQYLPHTLQLHLFVLTGRLELVHPLCQVVLLHQLFLTVLPAPQPGLAVRRRQPQPQQLDACLNSCRDTEREVESLIDLLDAVDMTMIMMRQLQRSGK